MLVCLEGETELVGDIVPQREGQRQQVFSSALVQREGQLAQESVVHHHHHRTQKQLPTELPQ